MELCKASEEAHWELASNILLEVVERCNARNVPLWTNEQVQVSSLKKSYSLDGLYFFQHNGVFVGCVFISFGLDDFWKDLPTDSNSMFFHKLAITNSSSSKGLGSLALSEIRSLAEKLNCEWLRCDCHGGRERLRNFYEQFGFEFVDRQVMYGFDVARYRMLTSA
ncbi:GNAT family N-acetyltransferase [Vibrio tubiashii]|uniref:GNAT family N-acetyltransferase n=1 Tax=Vibrio tubiashii TaxID=29498 RepID=UPI00234F6998|nr:GNAT family N-acetyltransferase [Vibrio tubiashii]WCP68797.1 GNAT family N-acetyltransferase [Vibrio tubiashii]